VDEIDRTRPGEIARKFCGSFVINYPFADSVTILARFLPVNAFDAGSYQPGGYCTRNRCLRIFRRI
jgi:hypothetical protein